VVLLCLLLVACSGAGSGRDSDGASPTPRSSSGSSGAGAPRDAPSVRWPTPAAGGLPASTAARLDGEMERWVETGLVPGVTAAVVTPRGVWTGAAGVDGAGRALEARSGMALSGYRTVLAVVPDREASVAVLSPSRVETTPDVQYLLKVLGE
jgi:hypothetical protein